MSIEPALDRTVSKVVSQAESEMIKRIDSAYEDALNKLRSSRGALESEYNKIIEDARKQAENLKRQVIGSSSLSARNKQLVVIEEAVNKAFEKAKERVNSVRGSDDYISMMRKLLDEALTAINTDAIVECNDEDTPFVNDLVVELSSKYKSSIEVSGESIYGLGGVRVKSRDGSMVYENTLESRVERLKPLIKKDIAKMFIG